MMGRCCRAHHRAWLRFKHRLDKPAPRLRKDDGLGHGARRDAKDDDREGHRTEARRQPRHGHEPPEEARPHREVARHKSKPRTEGDAGGCLWLRWMLAGRCLTFPAATRTLLGANERTWRAPGERMTTKAPRKSRVGTLVPSRHA